MIGDALEDGADCPPDWSDDRLQTALDQRRTDARYLQLLSPDTWVPGGGVVNLDYYAPYGDWEEDALLTDGQGHPLTPSAVEYQCGHWVFAAHTQPPVYVSGKWFDLYAVAADVLEQYAATHKGAYTFSPGAGNYTRSQLFSQPLVLAARYRSMQQPETVRLIRSDVNAV